jgi:repressor LexA
VLTAAQSTVMRIIRQHVGEYGFAPTLEELCEYTMTKSVGSMHKHLSALVRAGLIERCEGGWRQIKIKDVCPCCGRRMRK